MAAILELVLNETVQVPDLIIWLTQRNDEVCITEDLREYSRLKPDFVPSFLNYLRDETLHLVHCSKSSILSPAKTPTSIKLSRQNSLNKQKQPARTQRAESSATKRVQLFSPSTTSNISDLDVSPFTSKQTSIESPSCFGTKKHSPLHDTFERNHQKSAYVHSTPDYSKSKQRHSLADFIVTPENEQRKKRSPFSSNKKDRYNENSPSPHLNRRSTGKGKPSGNKARPTTTSPPVLNFGNLEDFPPVGPATSKKSAPSRRITPTPVTHSRTNDSFSTISNSSAISAEDDIKLLKEELAKVQETNLNFTIPPPTTPTKARLERLQSVSDISLAEKSAVEHERELNILADLYSSLIKVHLVPNMTVELFFLTQMLTSRGISPEYEIHTGSKDSDEVNYFSSLHNVVYFAVNVLEKQLRILSLLDKGTLRLLSDNLRVSDFSENLKNRLVDLHENASQKVFSPSLNTSFGSVSFQADTDNRLNFPNDRSFQVFKKQRDLFYETLREWEARHQTSGWSMIDSMGEKIRGLVSFRAELANYLHFARLFQAQLLAMCKDGYRHNADNEEEKITLLSKLKKSNPDKFKKLQERFIAPSSSQGPSPPVSFPGCQEFFRDFILAASNPLLNQHLIDSFTVKILELNDTQFVVPDTASDDELRESYMSCVLSLRLLAKFLGFLVFLPYQTPEKPPDMMETTCLLIRSKTTPPFDVLKCLQSSTMDHRMSLTVPWVIEYMAMMDVVAPGLHYYKAVMILLIQIYRQSGAYLLMCEKDYLSLLLVLMLGWLFQTPAFPDELFFTEMSTEVSSQPDKGSLDSLGLVDQHLVYSCCPYLGEVRSLLVEFSVGMSSRNSSIRKIKPISADNSDLQSVSDRQIQAQLEENFFHNQPASLKRTTEFVADRVASNFIKKLRAEVIGPAKKESRKQMAEAAQKHAGGSPVNKTKTSGEVHAVAVEMCNKTRQFMNANVASYCQVKVGEILLLMLPEDISSDVTTTSSMISCRIAQEKVLTWMNSHATSGSFMKDLQADFDKQLKLAMNNTSHNSMLTANASAVSLDSIVEQPVTNHSTSNIKEKNCQISTDLNTSSALDGAKLSENVTPPNDSVGVAISSVSKTDKPKEWGDGVKAADQKTKPKRRVNLITLSTISTVKQPSSSVSGGLVQPSGGGNGYSSHQNRDMDKENHNFLDKPNYNSTVDKSGVDKENQCCTGKENLRSDLLNSETADKVGVTNKLNMRLGQEVDGTCNNKDVGELNLVMNEQTKCKKSDGGETTDGLFSVQCKDNGDSMENDKRDFENILHAKESCVSQENEQSYCDKASQSNEHRNNETDKQPAINSDSFKHNNRDCETSAFADHENRDCDIEKDFSKVKGKPVCCEFPSKLLAGLKDIVSAIVCDQKVKENQEILANLSTMSSLLDNKDTLPAVKKKYSQLTVDLVCALICCHGNDDYTAVFSYLLRLWKQLECASLDTLLCGRQIWQLQAHREKEMAWKALHELLSGIIQEKLLEKSNVISLIESVKQQSWCTQDTSKRLDGLLD